MLKDKYNCIAVRLRMKECDLVSEDKHVDRGASLLKIYRCLSCLLFMFKHIKEKCLVIPKLVSEHVI